ncbi:MAG: hypothetical protein QXP84_06525 [Candidatus Korarchaeum sp.]
MTSWIAPNREARAKRSLEIKYEGGLVLRYHQGCLDKLKEMLAQELFESTGKLVRGSM